jgi:hypothetical protein
MVRHSENAPKRIFLEIHPVKSPSSQLAEHPSTEVGEGTGGPVLGGEELVVDSQSETVDTGLLLRLETYFFFAAAASLRAFRCGRS